mgnify:CR=1 FL=1
MGSLKELDQILNKINDLIDTYESGAWQTVENLRIMQRELSCYNYYLSKYNIEFYNNHNKEQYNFKGAVNAGKIHADYKIPNLRMTRKIMEAVKNVIWSMRSEISIIKNEN